jgi:hypothetical protein
MLLNRIVHKISLDKKAFDAMTSWCNGQAPINEKGLYVNGLSCKTAFLILDDLLNKSFYNCKFHIIKTGLDFYISLRFVNFAKSPL